MHSTRATEPVPWSLWASPYPLTLAALLLRTQPKLFLMGELDEFTTPKTLDHYMVRPTVSATIVQTSP